MPELDEDLIGIHELADELDRATATVRQWVRQRSLPRELRPKKVGGRKQLAWPREKVPALQEFADEMSSRQGWQH